MHNLLLHIPIHHRTVMMNHVPPSIMELEDIGHIEWPCIHVNICFHGNPSHVCQNPSTYIPNLKVQSLIPVEYELPALHYSIIPATWIIVLLNNICSRQNGINSNEVRRMSIISQTCQNFYKFKTNYNENIHSISIMFKLPVSLFSIKSLNNQNSVLLT
jgi:hypothetical protein